jgi:hypothetical protein
MASKRAAAATSPVQNGQQQANSSDPPINPAALLRLVPVLEVFVQSFQWMNQTTDPVLQVNAVIAKNVSNRPLFILTDGVYAIYTELEASQHVEFLKQLRKHVVVRVQQAIVIRRRGSENPTWQRRLFIKKVMVVATVRCIL